MASKGHFIIACLITSIAVLYQIECNSNRWMAIDMANISTTPEQLARFLTNADMVNKWFSWIYFFKEADGRPLGQGKKYQAHYKIPFYGDYSMIFRLAEYKANEWYVLESDSLLKPRFTIRMRPTNDKITNIEFRKNRQNPRNGCVKVNECVCTRPEECPADIYVTPACVYKGEDCSLEFRRQSALYHLTVGPLGCFVSQQQLRHALFSLKMFFPF